MKPLSREVESLLVPAINPGCGDLRNYGHRQRTYIRVLSTGTGPIAPPPSYGARLHDTPCIAVGGSRCKNTSRTPRLRNSSSRLRPFLVPDLVAHVVLCHSHAAGALRRRRRAARRGERIVAIRGMLRVAEQGAHGRHPQVAQKQIQALTK